MRNLQGQGRVFEEEDCIYFDSGVEHSGVATGENGCKCFFGYIFSGLEYFLC
jgi:hypothetical protein